jgi:hypothetical protein
MKPSEIEYWAHRVMDLVASGHAVEEENGDRGKWRRKMGTDHVY